eukprot:scaffold292915_cov35-Prasinocladus_malaysianus.AAC.1
MRGRSRHLTSLDGLGAFIRGDSYVSHRGEAASCCREGAYQQTQNTQQFSRLNLVISAVSYF